MQPIIEFKGLSKVFGRGANRKVAVDQLDLAIEPGQVYGFLGINGAGKTTTIRMLLNLIFPSAGYAKVFGENPQENPHVLQKVGALVEGATFYPYLSGWDNLEVIGNTRGGFETSRAESLLQTVGLSHAKAVKFSAYSTGMKQRLGIAAALLHDPELVVLDEPTSGMDPAGIREMRRFIRDLAHQHGKTVFLTSHLLSEMQQTCDRLAIIHQGRLIREGNLESLLAQHREIDVDVSDLEQAHTILSEKWETKLTTASKALLRINAPREDTPKIIRTLVNAEIDIFAVIPHQQTLEDYFLQQVGSDEAP